MAVLIETSIGDLVLDLYTTERPKMSLNFLKLCKIKFYNYCLFYSVQTNFIAQTGDPTGTGEGGKSVWGVINGNDQRYVEGELVPRLKHLKIGTISMICNDSNYCTSQFFLTLRANLDYLDGKHCVFGEVAEGFDVLQKFNQVASDKIDRPLQDIRILHTVIIDDPFDDPLGLIIPIRSPSPPSTLTDSNHIGVDEIIDEFEGKTSAEIQEVIALRESKANAHILEMVGDVPDADAKPPENVLFVCKLNPATSSEDLEIIFSRFGSILSCEVIRDQKTGDSLQYAFIEFESEDDCLKAYFKMDNVLIDDRRIHVDFSQSLAKTKYQKFLPSSASESTDNKYDMVFDDSELIKTKSSKDSSNNRKPDVEKQHKSREQIRTKREDRSKDNHSREKRRERSRERKSRSRERSRSRQRGNQIKERRDRSRERRDRSREGKNQSRGRKDRSRERKDKSREKRY